MREQLQEASEYGHIRAMGKILVVTEVFCSLAGMAQWIEHWPGNQSVASLIPSQGTCLGCGTGDVKEATTC